MSQPDDAQDGRCQRCGNSVSTRFRKVFGGNDATVHGCVDCMTLSELCEGQAAISPEEASAPTVE
jgi:hypothetical protein